MNRVNPREWIRIVIVAIGVAVALAVAWGLVYHTPRARAAESDSGTTIVTFNIAEAIEVMQWPAGSFTLSDGGAPGVPVVSEALSIRVRANASWGIEIRSDASSGQLREFDTSSAAYVPGGSQLGPVEWATNVNGPWTPLSSTPALMFTNMPPTGNDGQSVGFVLRVTPSFDHEPLPAGREYRIVLLYTAGVGL